MSADDDNEPLLLTSYTVGSVHRLLGERLIAAGFRDPSGKQIGYALTIQEATVLLAKLLAALHTDDTTPGAQPSIRIQRNRYATPRLEVEEFALLVRDDHADLLVRLANGLELPLVFPASDLRSLRELIERAESSIA